MTSPREAPVGDLARVAARTITSSIRATVGERDLSVGLVASIQTHGSLANWHPRASASFNPIDRWRTLLSRDVVAAFEVVEVGRVAIETGAAAGSIHSAGGYRQITRQRLA